MTKHGPLPVISPGALAQLRELAERQRKAEEELASAKRAILLAATEYREQFPGRGTVTMMADVISEVLGDSKDRRTQLSRQIGTVRRAQP